MNMITEPGAFHLGCNYWASHAGTRMWSDWQPEVVERDFRLLAESGLQTIRIFPLWPDFQPIHALGTAWNPTKEFRFGEEPLPDDAVGQAGLSVVMLERFAICLDLAERHGLHCIVGLVTGWMSGRLFVPPGLAGRNPLTDPLSIQWQVRFVREFVGAFKGHAAVCAWDLGNECNCMGAATREQAFVWAASITHAIRAADPSRPVVSGMHSLTPEGAWTMQDQGELTDLLTTHPYPPFTPHCGQDPVNTIRGILHGTAESRFYADIGGKPCLCEEFGTLGNMIADEATAADYVRACLFSLWANDCHGALWWCAFDQGHLAQAPYDWCAVERELGLFGSDGRRKPVAGVYREFRAMLDKLPFQTLPPRRTEAVCLLTRDQDHWGMAYSAFILAKQAGFDLTFRYAGQSLPDAPVYLMPCLKGLEILYRRHWPALLERVGAGATLYLSMDDALPSGFEALTGLRPTARERRAGSAAIALDGIPGHPVIPCAGGYRLNPTPVGAKVLASEPDGAPLLTEYRYGKGRVIFLGVPLEVILTTTPGVFHGAIRSDTTSFVLGAERVSVPDGIVTDSAPRCAITHDAVNDASAAWQLYRYIADGAMQGRAVRKDEPLLALTEHPVSETERIVVAVNQSPGRLKARVRLVDGWRLAECLHGVSRVEGREIVLDMQACDGAVLQVKGKK